MTPDLNNWAARHYISAAAMHDLRIMLGTLASMSVNDAETEAGVQSRVRLKAAQSGILLWRNNVGAMKDEYGRVVRYGLANDSKAMNQKIKSSDLVGIKPGGQMIVREVKEPGWVYTGTPREVAQLNFINVILSAGGDAAFISNADDF